MRANPTPAVPVFFARTAFALQWCVVLAALSFAGTGSGVGRAILMLLASAAFLMGALAWVGNESWASTRAICWAPLILLAIGIAQWLPLGFPSAARASLLPNASASLERQATFETMAMLMVFGIVAWGASQVAASARHVAAMVIAVAAVLIIGGAAAVLRPASASCQWFGIPISLDTPGAAFFRADSRLDVPLSTWEPVAAAGGAPGSLETSLPAWFAPPRLMGGMVGGLPSQAAWCSCAFLVWPALLACSAWMLGQATGLGRVDWQDRQAWIGIALLSLAAALLWLCGWLGSQLTFVASTVAAALALVAWTPRASRRRIMLLLLMIVVPIAGTIVGRVGPATSLASMAAESRALWNEWRAAGRAWIDFGCLGSGLGTAITVQPLYHYRPVGEPPLAWLPWVLVELGWVGTMLLIGAVALALFGRRREDWCGMGVACGGTAWLVGGAMSWGAGTPAVGILAATWLGFMSRPNTAASALQRGARG